ncbi:tetratricopeptide repeat protein [Oxalobacter sp. OttesenSCG-928-P03]|nr:tetratricopeptide repeat protein [Oxalobacter sp. OttesenSCG-928-P03]
MKRTFFILTVFLLSACTTVNEGGAENQTDTPVSEPAVTQPEGQTPVSSEAKKPEAEATSSAQPTAEAPPSVYLGSDLLYEILAADFAYKRGDYRLAYEGMMDAAKKTRDPRLAKRAAEIAVKERNQHEALDAIRLWYKLAPNSAEAEKYLIGFLIIEDRLDELQRLLSDSLAKAPPADRGALMYQYQQFLSSSKDKAKAFKTMEKIVEPYLDLPEAHIALSQMAFTNKDNARAEAEAREALRLKPDSELAVLTLAQAEADPIRSIQTLTAFLKQYPNSREVRISNGRMLIAQKEYERARGEFEHVLAAQPDDLLTLYSLGLLSIQQNDYPGAEKYLSRYLQVAKKEKKPESESYQAIFLLAQLAEEQKNYKGALEWMGKITEDADSEAWMLAQIKKAQILVKQGRVKDARSSLAALRLEYPMEEERLVLAEAQILRAANLNKEAYTLLKTSVEKAPSNINLLYDFSLAAEKVGRYDEMESALRKILEVDPNNQLAYNALGYSFADRNIRLDEAYVLIAKALALAPDDPYITDSMGWILFRQGKLKEAELMLRRAYELLPEVEVMAHLGEVLWISGQQDEAHTLFAEANKKDAQNEVLIETVKRLGVRLR